MASPAALIAARQVQISSRNFGARPSVASSSTTRRGLVSSARPIASICCSPPESWLPMLRRRSCRRGNSAYIFASVHRSPRCVATRFSSTVSVGKICRPSGTNPNPCRAITCGGRPVTSTPSMLTRPALGLSNPKIDLIVVVLPMPLRPNNVTTSPAATDRSIPNSTRLRPYALSRPSTRSIRPPPPRPDRPRAPPGRGARRPAPRSR